MKQLFFLLLFLGVTQFCTGQTVVTNISELSRAGITLSNSVQLSETEYVADFQCYYKKRARKCRGNGGMCMKGRISYDEDGEILQVSGMDGEDVYISNGEISYQPTESEIEVSLDEKN